MNDFPPIPIGDILLATLLATVYAAWLCTTIIALIIATARRDSVATRRWAIRLGVTVAATVVFLTL